MTGILSAPHDEAPRWALAKQLEAAGVTGQEINLETYGQLTDRLGRAFQRLGLKRVAKPVLTLEEHVARFAARKAAGEQP